LWTRRYLVSDRPFTTKAQRALHLADRESAKLAHEYIGTEHLLLGLLAEETSFAAYVLRRAGITADNVHELLRQSQSPPAAPSERYDKPSNDR
jgi:ATP-dependent Clp protease ATP-binding subunit ClpC